MLATSFHVAFNVTAIYQLYLVLTIFGQLTSLFAYIVASLETRSNGSRNTWYGSEKMTSIILCFSFLYILKVNSHFPFTCFTIVTDIKSAGVLDPSHPDVIEFEKSVWSKVNMVYQEAQQKLLVKDYDGAVGNDNICLQILLLLTPARYSILLCIY